MLYGTASAPETCNENVGPSRSVCRTHQGAKIALLATPLGRDEARRNNNHETWADVQISALAI